MMSSICLAKTAVSFGAAASVMRTQPANGTAVAVASNRRLVISAMVSPPFGGSGGAPVGGRGCLQYATCMPCAVVWQRQAKQAAIDPAYEHGREPRNPAVGKKMNS